MTDFLLELRSEEIPARMQIKAKDDLARMFAEEIAKAGLTATAIETFATPRRLALIARGLPDETAAVSEERKGPRVDAPEQAIQGFKRTLPDAAVLEEREDAKGAKTLFAIIEKPGLSTDAVLMNAIHPIVRTFPWPKSMRWGNASETTESLRWVRPLQGIVAIFGDQPIICGYEGIQSGNTTVGHRFHHSGPITIESADTYVEQLRAAHVIVHLSERTTLIRDGARAAAAAVGLTLVEDEGLVIENAGLTEWPVPLLGRFDAAFLDVPREVIQLTMRTNQKYFACVDANGALANAFVCTANIDASDGGAAIVAGNRKVLAARLSDAKFFWENDLKLPLAVQAEKLSQIVFHEKLGTVADKVERVAKLARWLVEEGIVKPSSLRGEGDAKHRERPEPHVTASPGSAGAAPPSPQSGEGLATLAETAARLCKADLVTGMVGEFPELQGIIGGHLARAQGLPDAVADAIRDHYKPVGQGDDVPTDPVTVAVSLADKLDTLVGFFFIDEKPTGSKDPFALRRAAIGIIRLILGEGLRFPLKTAIEAAAHKHLWYQIEREGDELVTSYSDSLADVLGREATDDEFADAIEKRVLGQGELYERLSVACHDLIDFFADRLKVQQREAGVRHDLIDAVFALGGEDDLVRLLARVKALQAFVGTAEGADLLAGYKRAANILKKSPSPLAGEGPSREARVGEGAGASAPEKTAHARQEQESLAADAADPSPRRAARVSPSPAGGEGQEELALTTALDTAEPLAAAAIDAENFEAAMSALATLRTPIDAFFENVTVNDPDPAKRSARLALLSRFRDAVHRVADFSKIEG